MFTQPGKMKILFLSLLIGLLMSHCQNGVFKPEEVASAEDFRGILKADSNVSGKIYAVVKPDHSLWVWGNNDNGTLGNGTTVSNELPSHVAIGNVVAIDLFAAAIVAADLNGDIWYWGHPIIYWTENVLQPIKISHIDEVVNLVMTARGVDILDKNGNVWHLKLQYPNHEPLSEWIEPQKIVTISGATEITENMVLLENRTVIGYGSTNETAYGGLADTLYEVKCVSSYGGFHSAYAKEDGSVWQWGRIRLKDGSWQTTEVPVQVDGLFDIIALDVHVNYNIALNSDGSVWYWGKDNPIPEKIPGIQNANLVTIGTSEYFFKKNDETYWIFDMKTHVLKQLYL